MQRLTDQGQQKINELAQRYGVSTDAVMALLQALVNGNGTMAQFNHRELGGGGQWMLGGMTMVGDMFAEKRGSRKPKRPDCSVDVSRGDNYRALLREAGRNQQQ